MRWLLTQCWFLRRIFCYIDKQLIFVLIGQCKCLSASIRYAFLFDRVLRTSLDVKITLTQLLLVSVAQTEGKLLLLLI